MTLSDSRSLTSPELKRHCAEKLPPYMVPKVVEFCDTLPRTGKGKIDRQRLLRETTTSHVNTKGSNRNLRFGSSDFSYFLRPETR